MASHDQGARSGGCDHGTDMRSRDIQDDTNIGWEVQGEGQGMSGYEEWLGGPSNGNSDEY